MKAIRLAVGSLLFVTLLSSISRAQVQRTFISGLGNDSNTCSRTVPCSTISHALVGMSTGREVIVLDSAGYGAASITRSVSIIASPEVSAAISVSSGEGIDINASGSDTIFLRGLTRTVVAQRTDSIDPKQLARFVVAGDLPAADEECDRLITYYRRLVAGDPKRKDSWTMLHVLNVGFYLAAKSEVLALKGDFGKAEQSLNDAERYATANDEFSSGLVASGWNEVIEATRGFIQEKRGDRNAAKKTYHNGPSGNARARLALIAYEESEQAEARSLALQDINNPTMDLVLGLLEEKGNNPRGAREWYEKGRDRLQQSTIVGKDNVFLPIYFCEGKTIVKALERLKY